MLAQNCDANNKHGLWLMSRINKYDGESFTNDYVFPGPFTDTSEHIRLFTFWFHAVRTQLLGIHVICIVQ